MGVVGVLVSSDVDVKLASDVVAGIRRAGKEGNRDLALSVAAKWVAESGVDGVALAGHDAAYSAQVDALSAAAERGKVARKALTRIMLALVDAGVSDRAVAETLKVSRNTPGRMARARDLQQAAAAAELSLSHADALKIANTAKAAEVKAMVSDPKALHSEIRKTAAERKAAQTPDIEKVSKSVERLIQSLSDLATTGEDVDALAKIAADLTKAASMATARAALHTRNAA